MAGEAHGQLLPRENLLGVPVGVAIHGFEHSADLPRRGVKPWGIRAGDPLRTVVRVLAQDATDSEGSLVGAAKLLAGLGGDLPDEFGDACPHLVGGERISAGERAEGKAAVPHDRGLESSGATRRPDDGVGTDRDWQPSGVARRFADRRTRGSSACRTASRANTMRENEEVGPSKEKEGGNDRKGGLHVSS